MILYHRFTFSEKVLALFQTFSLNPFILEIFQIPIYFLIFSHFFDGNSYKNFLFFL